MAYYYSASERAFFSSEFMTVGEMPADKVAVADGTWKTLVADQSAGKIIRTGASNAPESAAQSLAALTGYAVPAGMTVAGGVSATGSISAGGALTAGGTLTVKGGASLASASVSGTMDVTGTTNLKSTLTVAGKTTAKAMSATDISASTITTTGNASVGGTLTVKGSAVVGGKNVVLTVNGFTANASGAVTVPNYEQDGVKYVANPDYNTITASGFYHCTLDGAVNGPGYAAKMIVFSQKTAVQVTQVVFPIYNATSRFFCPKIRSRNMSGEWEAWKTILLSENDESVRALEFAAKDGRFIAEMPDVVKGTTPSKSVFRQLWFRDGTGGAGNAKTNVIGAIEQVVRSDGATDIKMYACKNAAGTDERAQILVGWKDYGGALTPYSTAPATPKGSNGTEIVTAGWGNGQWLKLDGMNTMTGTIKSSVNGENSFVGAANGGTIINGTGKNGAFVPLWQYESTSEGSFVLSGYKNAFRIDFLSKEAKAAGTNTSDWTLTLDETGRMFVQNDLTIGGMLRLKGLGYRNVAYLEDAEAEISGQEDFVLAGGNQGTFICSGESGANPETTKAFRRSLKRADEDIVLVADNNVVIATNAQNMNEAEVRKFTITNGGDVRFPSRFYPDIAGGHWHNSPYVLQSGNIERGANPSSNQYLYIPFYDKNGIENAKNRLAKIEFSRRTDGMTYIQMGVNSPANATGETFCGITARWRLIGGEYVAETMVSHHPGADSNDYSAATTKWVRDLVQAAVPTGTILPFDGTNVPSGYLVCNGAAVSRTTYAALFAVLGTRHGEGDGKTTFNLPNAHRRFLEMTTTTSEVGETVEAGLPNITGQFRAQGSPDKRTKNSGAFANDGKGRIDGGLSNEGDYEDLRSFNASRCSALYGGSSTVQPPSLRALAIIKF
jgi:hypothetical protein